MRYLLLLLMLLPSIAVASDLITDTNVRPRPSAPPAFNADHITIDPTFGTTILRVTGPYGSNAVHESNETQNLVPIQHFHNPWNCIGDLFVIFGDRLGEGAGQRIDLYSFDKTTFSATRLREIARPASKINYNSGIHFATDPTLPIADRKWILYGVDKYNLPATIKRWNVDLNNAHDGLAAGASEVLHSDPEGINQLTVSVNDDRFSYYTNSGSDKVRVWVKSTNTTYTADCGSWDAFDETQMTPDGQFVFIKGHEIDGQDYTVRYNYDMTNKVEYSSYSSLHPDDFAGKHSGFGEWWVNESASGACGHPYCLAKRKPIDGRGSPVYIFSSDSHDVAMHPSYSVTGYVFGAIFTVKPYNNTTLYEDEVLMIKDDGTEVTRLAHAWSNFYNNSWDQIPCYASPDRNYVIFYSNWNGQNADARHDIFIVSTSIFNSDVISVPEIINISITN